MLTVKQLETWEKIDNRISENINKLRNEYHVTAVIFKRLELQSNQNTEAILKQCSVISKTADIINNAVEKNMI